MATTARQEPLDARATDAPAPGGADAACHQETTADQLPDACAAEVQETTDLSGPHVARQPTFRVLHSVPIVRGLSDGKIAIEMATYPPRHISFTAWKACTGTSARSRLAGGFTAWIDLMRYGQPLAAVFGGPSPEFATRKQRLGHLVEVLTQCGVRPRHGKAGLFSLCQHAGLSVSRPTFSRWVNERPGRDGSLSRDDAEKLFAAVQQAEMDASRRVSGTVAPDGKVLKGRISSTSEGMANWLGDGLLSHAPLLAGNEWFKLYEHLEGLAFAAALMLNLGNNAVTKIILTPSYRLALGIPDAKLKLGDVGALLEAVRPGHDGNLSVVRGYRSLAERLENFRTREGHSSLALAAGYALEASQNHLPTKKGRQTVHSCIVGLARTWV